jgi:hypothetical protein
MTTTTRRIHDAVVLVAAITGILFFWLLSQGAVSQGIAAVATPLCFVAIVITISSAVLHSQRK